MALSPNCSGGFTNLFVKTQKCNPPPKACLTRVTISKSGQDCSLCIVNP